jgi:small nuclear ribonucleoprotein (snRNP)-like protein
MNDQAELEELRKKVKGLEKELSVIRDVLNTKDNWHSEIKDMLNKTVLVSVGSGEISEGVLLWTDRYNLCVETTKCKKRRVYSKGAIEYIELAD